MLFHSSTSFTVFTSNTANKKKCFVFAFGVYMFFFLFLFFCFLLIDGRTTESAILMIISISFSPSWHRCIFAIVLTQCDHLSSKTDVRKSILMWHTLYQHDTIFIMKFDLIFKCIDGCMYCSTIIRFSSFFLGIPIQFAVHF